MSLIHFCSYGISTRCNVSWGLKLNQKRQAYKTTDVTAPIYKASQQTESGNDWWQRKSMYEEKPHFRLIAD